VVEEEREAPPPEERGGEEELEWVDLVPVFRAPDEAGAIHVRSLLASAGLDARIRSAQVPWLDGIMASGVGFWGQVMVPRAEAEAARALLADFWAASGGSPEA
jgi:hypothetical protein